MTESKKEDNFAIQGPSDKIKYVFAFFGTDARYKI